jgi:hypothetical protein
MYPSQSPPAPRSASSDTATSDPAFVETVEYRRFVEFCDACREFRYIGLCYGAPGIGKTLSALRYSRAEMILKAHREPAESRDQLPIDTVLYTTEVVNTPASVAQQLNPGLALLYFQSFPGFNFIVTAFKSRNFVLKPRTKFVLKFVRDISTKMTLSSFRASVSVRDLSTNRSTNSGIYVLQTSPPEHIPGFKCRATRAPVVGARASRQQR